ncbi:hypothetical protein BLA17378_03788 [Burkholderia aenigmatica]|uniref:Uncharacterized protein n=1 Tax=Burkholderia aenigmatica TaxID=2015348 RepID=A0ABY6XTG2_9BURK|nr:hypothetical protein [Burkholderia aenigmatica]VWC79096.1 hypothetical protein BLA17378_03788 [Burkholderia aenigmatica]VWD12152.1 hypothetical protein BLA18628_03278 [Burkholderia aenigmatica]
MVERWWRWQPSETKELTWTEVRDYAYHAALMTKKRGVDDG